MPTLPFSYPPTQYRNNQECPPGGVRGAFRRKARLRAAAERGMRKERLEAE